MGLKTTNYEVKNLGITLPEAYAIVKDLMVSGHNGLATIIVQSSRENAEKVLNGEMKPLEEVEIKFTVNRDSNDRATAYEKAKGQREGYVVNEETGKIEQALINEPFYGWQDDIV